MREKLLLVEDKLLNASDGFSALTEAGYEVDLAFDLETARFFMDRNEYAGIISDVCFQERGVNSTTDIHRENTLNLDLLRSENNLSPFMDTVRSETQKPGGLERFLERLSEADVSELIGKSLGFRDALQSVRDPAQDIKCFRALLDITDDQYDQDRSEVKNIDELCRKYQEQFISHLLEKDGVSQSAIAEWQWIQEQVTLLRESLDVNIPEAVQKAFLNALRRSHLESIEVHYQSASYDTTSSSGRDGAKAINSLTLKLSGETSTSLRDEVTKEGKKSYTEEAFDICKSARLTDSRSYKREVELIAQHNSRYTGLAHHSSNPALGHFIFQRAREQLKKVVAVTSSSHAAHAVPTLIADKIVKVEELEGLEKFSLNTDFRATNHAVFTESTKKSREAYACALNLLKLK